MFCMNLCRLWSDWRHPLMFVQPDMVVRWQRERFRRFGARLSKPLRRGRFVDRMPAVRKDLREAQTDLLALGSGQRLVTTVARV